jgi:cell division inhibitor SepF
MKMNDDDGLEDDYFDDDYDDGDYEDYEEEKPKKRILKKQPPEEDEYEEEKPVAAPQPTPFKTKPKTTKSSKISPMRPKKSGGVEVCVIRPKSMDDAQEITETLLEDCTVVLNMEGLDIEVAQRIIDFTSGSCYAIKGNLQRISTYIFIATPETVDISGDFQEILSGAFEVPSFGTRF